MSEFQSPQSDVQPIQESSTPADPKPSGGGAKRAVLFVVWILLLGVLAGVIYFRNTEQGRKTWESIVSPELAKQRAEEEAAQKKRVAAEREAAAKLEEKGVFVIQGAVPDGDDDFTNDVKAITNVNVMKPELVDEETLALIGKLYYLETLDLGNTELTDELVTHLADLREVTVLVVSNTKVTDASLEYVGNFHNVQSLFLAGTVVSDEGLPKLAGLKTMKILDLSNTKVTDAGLVHLTELDQVEHLLLDGCAVTEEGLTKMIEGMDKIGRLGLKGVKLDDDPVMHKEAIARLRKLASDKQAPQQTSLQIDN